MAVARDSCLGDIIATVAFTSKDSLGLNAIQEKLRARGCITPAGLETWTRTEVQALVSSCEITEKPRYYIRLLTTATGVQLGEADESTVKAGWGGGDQSGACSKQRDATVNWSTEVPDGIVYEGVPRRGEVDKLSREDGRRLLDRMTIWGHFHSSEAIGVLPLQARAAFPVCRALLPMCGSLVHCIQPK